MILECEVMCGVSYLATKTLSIDCLGVHDCPFVVTVSVTRSVNHA